MGKYTDMFTHGMVFNGIADTIETARTLEYPPEKAVEEAAFALAILCQITNTPLEVAMHVLRRCMETQGSAHYFAADEAAEA